MMTTLADSAIAGKFRCLASDHSFKPQYPGQHNREWVCVGCGAVVQNEINKLMLQIEREEREYFG